MFFFLVMRPLVAAFLVVMPSFPHIDDFGDICQAASKCLLLVWVVMKKDSGLGSFVRYYVLFILLVPREFKLHE
jgi:hypothetical protein